MTQQITVFGYGAVGKPIVDQLVARGDRVRVATRRQPASLAAEIEHMPCDVLDAGDVLAALDGL
jgi:nucleoside-diphosphate-sugar epimerase